MHRPTILMTILILFSSLAGCTLPEISPSPDEPACTGMEISPFFTLEEYNMDDSTLGMDQPVPPRLHRSADILARSGSGDEPTLGEEGPDVAMSQEGLFSLVGDDRYNRTYELDAISGFKPLLDENFSLAFSVDMTSVGNGFGGTFRVEHQVFRNHVAGDVFFALPDYSLSGPATPANFHLDATGMGATLSMDPCFSTNQRDVDLGPNVSRHGIWLDSVYDDIDGLSYDILGPEGHLLFSISKSAAVDPTLSTNLPVDTNGADILMYEPGGLITTFAKHSDLGLATDDELDALIVFDDGDKVFGSKDLILFSLATGSTTLTSMNWSGADVFQVTGDGTISFFSGHGLHGLDRADELNALGLIRVSEGGPLMHNPEGWETTPPTDS